MRKQITDLVPLFNKTTDGHENRKKILIESMKKYGQIYPIIVYGIQVIKGWARVEAAKELGYIDIECVEIIISSEKEAMEVRLAIELSKQDTNILLLGAELKKLDPAGNFEFIDKADAMFYINLQTVEWKQPTKISQISLFDQIGNSESAQE